MLNSGLSEHGRSPHALDIFYHLKKKKEKKKRDNLDLNNPIKLYKCSQNVENPTK